MKDPLASWANPLLPPPGAEVGPFKVIARTRNQHCGLCRKFFVLISLAYWKEIDENILICRRCMKLEGNLLDAKKVAIRARRSLEREKP